MFDAKGKVFSENPYTDSVLLSLGYLIDTEKLNPKVIEPILRHLLLVDNGTGFHTIELVLRDHKLATIKGADTQIVNEVIRK